MVFAMLILHELKVVVEIVIFDITTESSTQQESNSILHLSQWHLK